MSDLINKVHKMTESKEATNEVLLEFRYEDL